MDESTTNQQYVSIEPDAGGMWTFKIRADVNRIGESIEAFRDVTAKVFEACEDIFRPLEIEFSIQEMSDDGPMSAALTPREGTEPTWLGTERLRYADDEGETGLPAALEELSPRMSIADVEVLRGESRITLADFDGWVDRTNHERVKRSGEPSNYDPLTIEIHRCTSRGDEAEFLYLVDIATSTSLWFHETELARQNRERLEATFGRIVDALPVFEIGVISETHSKPVMKSFIPD